MDNKVKIAAAIVVYNKAIQEIASINAIVEMGFDRVLVCDNSDNGIAYGNAEKCVDLSISYINMGGNQGLSAAYTKAIAYAEGDDYICLFDDDTVVPGNYLNAIKHSIAASKSDVLVPLTYAHDKIISPCNMSLLSFKPITDLRQLREPYSAINSGMCLKRSYAIINGHDLALFIDYVDHAFMKKAWERHAAIQILPEIKLSQRLSLYERTDKASAMHRQRLFERDCCRYYSDSVVRSIYASLLILKRRLLLHFRY